MSKEEILSEFREFYNHEIDEYGFPYTWIDNRVHTIFQLRGSKSAYAAAIAFVSDEMLKLVGKESEYDKIQIYTIGDTLDIDIRTNNYIPQLYDGIKTINGISEINYAVYDAAHGVMYTDNRGLGCSIKSAHKINVDIQVDDEPDMFPDQFEFTLPDLNEPD